MNPDDPLEIDTVPFGFCIVRVTGMMFGFMRKMKREIIFAESFVLFFPVAPELNSGS